jgi:two-component system response regulator AdeR
MLRTPHRSARRVLLVEDDADSAEALQVLLERAGYEATCVNSAAGALARLKQDDRPDVMLLDLTLRDLSGNALVDAFRAAAPLPPTVVISAAPERTLRGAAEQLHASGALRKPFGTEAFLLAVSDALSATTARR